MFTYDELRLIKMAIETEIIERGRSPQKNAERIERLMNLFDKATDAMNNAKNAE